MAYLVPNRRTARASLALLLLGLLGWGVWSISPRHPRATLKTKYRGHLVCFSPDDKYMATAPCRYTVNGYEVGVGGPIYLWDVEKGTKRLCLGEDYFNIVQIAFSPDNQYVAVRQKKGGLKLWEAATGRELVIPYPLTQEDLPLDFWFSPDSRFLVFHVDSFPAPDGLMVWEIMTNQEFAAIKGRLGFISDDGKYFVTYSRSDNRVSRVLLWRMTDSSLVFEGEYPINCNRIAFAPNSNLFVCADGFHTSTTISLHDMETGTRRWSKNFSVSKGTLQSISFSPRGRFVAVKHGGHWQSSISLFGVEKPELVGTYNAESIFSNDDNWLAVSNMTNAEVVDLNSFGIKALDANDQREVPLADRCPIELSSKNTLAVEGLIGVEAPSPIIQWLSKYIPSLQPKADCYIVRLWDVETGSHLGAMHGYAATFSPDGSLVAIMQTDGTLQVWDVPPAPPWATVAIVALLLWSILIGFAWLSFQLVKGINQNLRGQAMALTNPAAIFHSGPAESPLPDASQSHPA